MANRKKDKPQVRGQFSNIIDGFEDWLAQRKQGNSQFEPRLNTGGDTWISKGFDSLTNQQTSFLPGIDGLNGVIGNYDTSHESAERNDMFLQYLLQLIQTNDQRAYDRSVLNEQRIYDTPTNMLARLMAAGISRDAAIQLINGAGGSAGSALVGSGSNMSVPSPTGVSGSQNLRIADTVISALQCVGSLVSAGFSIPMAFNQYKLMSNQQYMSNQQREAYDVSSAAFTLLSSSGLELNEDNFGSIDAVCKSLEGLQGSNPAVADFIKSGGLIKLRQTAPYSSPFLNQLYRNERDSRDYSTSFRANVSLLDAQKDLARANENNLRKQLDVFEQQIDSMRSSQEYTDALKSLVAYQREVLKSEVRSNNASAYSTELENKLTESWMNADAGDGRTGLQRYTDYHIQELIQGVKSLSYLNDNDAWKKEADAFLKNQDNLISTYELATLYANGEISFLSNSDEDIQDLLYFCRAAEKCQLFNYVRTIADAETAGNWQFHGAGGSKSAADEQVEILLNKGKKKSTWRKIWDWKPFAH